MKTCFLIRQPKLAVVYVYVMNNPKFHQAAVRFVESYRKHAPGLDHETVVACTLGRPNAASERLFSGLPSVRFFVHNNAGYDIGAFQAVVKDLDCDLMICLGAGVYFRQDGWLRRILEAWQKHGVALYGAMGNGGNARVSALPHIRTVAFWLPPDLLRAYPIKVERPEQRYPFEHGPQSLSQWVWKVGLECWMVAQSGEYRLAQWNSLRNGFQRGNQSELLMGDRLCDPPFGPG